MPWKERRAMALKAEFVARATQEGANVAALCREYGIARQTAYKWLRRFKESGPEGLEEQSRRPHSAPMATAEQLVTSILEAREAHPSWGPKKLQRQLLSRLGEQTPSVRTIARVLKRCGQIRERRRRNGLSLVERAPQATAVKPNDVWTVDFKGWWRTRDGSRCEPLTVRDAYSRYVLSVRLMPSTSSKNVRAVFEHLFQRYGIPGAIQRYNGVPFIAVNARGGLTKLSAWWVSLGIRIVRSRPGKPQDNGAHERMHRDLQAEVAAFPAADSLLQQRQCDRWRQQFNHVRAHEALKGDVPADHYKAARTRSIKPIPPAYASDMKVHRISRSGCFKHRGEAYFVSTAIIGHRIALAHIEGFTWRVWFYDVDLGTIELQPDDSVLVAAQSRNVDRTPHARRDAQQRPKRKSASHVARADFQT
jgi:putative transposase